MKQFRVGLLMVAVLAALYGAESFVNAQVSEEAQLRPGMVQPHRQSCASEVTDEDTEFNLQSIPLDEWIRSEDSQFHWETNVGDPELRLDQRNEVGYSATVRSRDLTPAGSEPRDLVFISGVDDVDGRRLATSKVSKKVVVVRSSGNIDITFNGCVFLQPGNYSLWMALYDPAGGKHNVIKKRVRVSRWNDDPLPELNGQSPLAEFPEMTGSSAFLLAAIPGSLNLPVANKKPLEVELVFVVNPSEQFAGTSNYGTVAAIGTLSQMKMKEGSISVTGFNLVKHEVMFTQAADQTLDFPRLVEATGKAADNWTISLDALGTRKSQPMFFREFLREKLEAPRSGAAQHVVILISEAVSFDRGGDTSPLTLTQDCHCRVFYLGFRLNRETVDDIGSIVKRVSNRSFNVTSGQDMRKALSVIVREIEALK